MFQRVAGTVWNGECVSVSASDYQNGIVGDLRQAFTKIPEFWSEITNLVLKLIVMLYYKCNSLVTGLPCASFICSFVIPLRVFQNINPIDATVTLAVFQYARLWGQTP